MGIQHKKTGDSGFNYFLLMSYETSIQIVRTLVKYSLPFTTCIWSIYIFEQVSGHSHELTCEPYEASSFEWTKYSYLVYTKALLAVNRL